MEVLPLLGGPYLSCVFVFMLCLWLLGIALRLVDHLKYKKNLPDAGGTVIKEAVLSR